MTAAWIDLPTGLLTGDNAFRLLPDDPLESRPATATVTPAAGGHALLTQYTWEHPDDGPQSGVLLVGSPDQDGQVEATWLDSWHQQPGPLRLTGPASPPTRCALAATYSGAWGWQIDLTVEASRLLLLMRHVVPAEAIQPDAPASLTPGPYDVMVLDVR